jgi:hypothetical protein
VPIGPVEYVIIGFPGNKFTGEIVPELAKLIESGTIRVIDLVFIYKDEAGNVASFEFDQQDELAIFNDLDGEVGGIIGEEDIAYAAEALEPNSSAALLIWEDTWAAPFVQALRNSGGVLIEGSRIPHELIDGVVSGLSPAT